MVNAAVEITRQGGKRTQHLAGLVNAVLRALPETVSLPPQKLPRWLRQPLVHTFGRDTVTAIGPRSGDWIEIRDDRGRTGFMSAQFLSAERP